MLLGFVLYPLITNFWYSVISYDLGKTTQDFVGLKNYIKILNDNKFLNAIQRTFVWTAGNIVGFMTLGVATAFLLNKEFFGKFLLKACVLVPWVLPEIVTGYTWKWMLMGDFGIINTLLSKFGIVSADYSWFRDGGSAMFAVILANVWRAVPFVAVLVYAKLKTCPSEMLDAAHIDGASGVQLQRYIVFPFLKPVLVRVLTLGFIWTFNAFSVIFTMSGGGPLRKTEIVPLIIQRTAFRDFKFSEASAMSITMSLILLVLLLFLNRLSRMVSKSDEGEVKS
jgi:ABC-type sugar transport system permease subunit